MMDFGKILDQWEEENRRASPGRSGKRNARNRTGISGDNFESLIDAYDVVDKDTLLDSEKPVVPGDGRQKLKRMPHERTLDLHGCTVSEGIAELERFIKRARGDKLKKILIIHGKGKHSPKGPVLKDAVRSYLAESSMIGETGKPKRNDGGDGATWAILRYRSR